MMGSLVDVRDVTKIFGGTRALDGVSLAVARGEIVALLGHNGSGKSTLVKILDGVQPPDGGSIDLHDTTVHVIHQSLGLIDSLSAIENLDITRRGGVHLLAPFSSARERARITRLMARFGIEINPDTPVGKLTPAQRTIVAIVRALDGWGEGEHLLVLDEPTATLHDDETAVLLDSIRSIAAEGVGVIYISHRLNEVIDLADRAVVLRNGRVAAEFLRGEYSQDDLLEVIAGDPPASVRSRTHRTVGEVVMRVSELSGAEVRGVDIQIHSGEIVGVAGLIGSGMEQLNGLIFGAMPAQTGAINVNDTSVPLGVPHRSIAAGIGYLPPDRLSRAGIREHTARENLTLPNLSPLQGWHGAISIAEETNEVDRWMERVNALPQKSSAHRLHAFSGGNQQKILLAKWLRIQPSVLLLDEPTQGVDVGAQGEIHALLREAAEAGASFVVASSDTHELAELCDRVLVMQDGRIRQELSGSQIDESAIIHAILDGRNGRTDLTQEPLQ